MGDEQQYTDAQLSDGTTLRFLGQLTPDQVRDKVATYRTKRDIASNPPSVPRPKLNMEMSPLGSGYEGPGAHDNPGSFEGHPENVGEWIPQGPGQIGAGVRDIAKGQIAHGGHELISGAGNTMLPMAPFTAIAAPGTTLKALAGGYVGGKLGGTAADVLGADPDQSQFASDLTGIAGGGVAAAVPWSRIGQASIGAAKGAASHIPIVSPIVRGAIKGAAKSWRSSAPEEIAEAEIISPSGVYRSGTGGSVSREVIRPKLLGNGEPQIATPSEVSPAPYRFGPGQIEPEDLNAPNPLILGRNQGVRVPPKPPLRFLGSGEPQIAPPDIERPGAPIQFDLRPNRFADVREDQAINDAMNEHLESEGRAARAQEGRRFAAGNSMDKPKWLMQAEAKQQQLMDAAEAKAKAPVRYTKTKPLSRFPEIATPGDDLTDALQASLDKVRRNRQ